MCTSHRAAPTQYYSSRRHRKCDDSLSGSRHRDKRGRRNRSIEQRRRFVFRVNTERRQQPSPSLVDQIMSFKNYPKTCYPKHMVFGFFFFFFSLYSLLLCTPKFLHRRLVEIIMVATMFSAAQNSASTLATTFLTGHGCSQQHERHMDVFVFVQDEAFFSTKDRRQKRSSSQTWGKRRRRTCREINMGQLQAGYLFPEIARIRNAHLKLRREDY